MREFDLLKHIYQRNRSLPGSVIVPPGDDMAVIRVGGDTSGGGSGGGVDLLVTTDQVADGVHVKLEMTPIELVGRKVIVRNLSDVAAMAALPVGAVAAVCLPRNFGDDRAKKLFDAMADVAAQYNCPLVGGDISIWDHPLLLTVTIFAETAGVKPVLRSGAKPGDSVYVSGVLGGAWNQQGGGPHLAAEPRIKLARALAQLPIAAGGLHAMIDISDGLASDLGHICEQSSVGAEIHVDKIPCRKGVSVEHALSDGEDYELCFTAAGNVPPEVEGVKITRIGRIVSGQGITLIQPDGSRQPLTATGWEHTDE